MEPNNPDLEVQFHGRFWGVFGLSQDEHIPPAALFRSQEEAEAWLDWQEATDQRSKNDYTLSRVDVYGSVWNGPEKEDPKASGFQDFVPEEW